MSKRYLLPQDQWTESGTVLTEPYTHRDIAEDEVDHLFAAADDDGNGILSFLEVLEHHDVFVGSEATDYGDHLHNLDRFEDEL